MFETYSTLQRSSSSTYFLVGVTITCNKARNFVLPCVDVLKFQECLHKERINNRSLLMAFTFNFCISFLTLQLTWAIWWKLCVHAWILTLEEAIDTNWVYMWEKFGGYLFLVLPHATRAKKAHVQITTFQLVVIFIMMNLSI